MFYIWITIRCYFASLSWYICVFHSIFFEMFVSEITYFIIFRPSKWYKVYGICFRSEIICSSYRITTIVPWAKPFGCEKLNKRDFKLLSRCYVSFAFLAKLAEHRDVLSPDLFSHGSPSSTSRSDLLKLPNFVRSTDAQKQLARNVPYLSSRCISTLHEVFRFCDMR